MTFGRVAGALIACSLLGLAGCADAEPIEAAPSASATLEDPAASASPSAPESPKPETAKQFIRRWVALQNKMQVDGDTREYRLRSTKCGTCIAFADRIDGIYASGGSVRTTGWKIRRVLSEKGADRAKVVEAVVDSGTTRYVEEQGAEPQLLPGGRLTERFELRRSAGAWQMFEYSEVAS